MSHVYGEYIVHIPNNDSVLIYKQCSCTSFHLPGGGVKNVQQICEITLGAVYSVA